MQTRRPACVVIKCDVSDLGSDQIVKMSEWPYEDPHVESDDEAFVWLSEQSGGSGLSMRGFVRHVDRRGPLTLTVEIIDRTPLQAFGVKHLKPFRDDTTTILGRLARKLYRSSLNKIAMLAPDEGDFFRHHFASSVGFSPTEDLEDIRRDGSVDATTREALIQARLGQGLFRAALLKKWNGRCSVTACSVPQVLRASHIKPWRLATNVERLNPDNGLLLIAQLDAMFDAGYVTFDDEGILVASTKWPLDEDTYIPSAARLASAPNRVQRAFLDFHRRFVFRG